MTVPRSHFPQSGLFHIICRGNNHNCLFQEEEDSQTFYSQLYYYKTKFPFNIFHYSFMPTHVHMEVETDCLMTVSKALQGSQLTYYNYYQAKYKYSGHLWNGRYKSIPIEKESHQLRCGRYIEINAPKAGLVAHPSEYRWSSYHFYACSLPDQLVTTDPFFLSLGNEETIRRAAYCDYVIEGMSLDWSYERALFNDPPRRPRGRPRKK